MLIAGICPLVLFFTLSIPLALWLAVLGVAMQQEKRGAGRWLAAFLASPFMQKLGRISYSTYLVHMCCLWPLQSVIFHFFPQASPGWMLCLLAPSSALLIYGVSCAMHRWIEVPGMRLGRRLTTPHATR